MSTTMETTSYHQHTDPDFSYNGTQVEMDPNRALAMMLLRTVCPVIVLMGTVGNTLSFCVLVRRRMRSTPMYFYLTLLAVADTFVLYVSAFKVWIRALTKFELLHVSNVGCKLFMFVLLCSFYMSAWLIVLVTLDRFLVIWFPFRGYLLMRIRQARLTAALLAIVVGIYNIHVFWTMGLHRFGSAPTCDADQDNFFMTHIFEYLKLVSYCVVPFVIVIALNVGILLRINKVYSNAAMHQERGLREAAVVYRHQTPLVVLGRPSTPSAGNADDDFRGDVWPQRQNFGYSPSSSDRQHLDAQKLRQRRLTRMLLFISFAWLVLTAPFTLHSFLPEQAASSDSFSSNNFTALSVTPCSNISQSMIAYDPNESTLLDPAYGETFRNAFANHFRTTTANKFLAEEHPISASPTPGSNSPPSVSISPSRYLLVKTICFLLMYVNHAINFYLYCLTGKRFRKELTAMMNCERMPFSCDGGGEVTPDVGAARNVPLYNNRRRDVHAGLHQQHACRVPLHQEHQLISTSSRTRSSAGRIMLMVNANRKSPSELNDERYS